MAGVGASDKELSEEWLKHLGPSDRLDGHGRDGVENNGLNLIVGTEEPDESFCYNTGFLLGCQVPEQLGSCHHNRCISTL